MIDEQLELDGYLFGTGCPWQVAAWDLGDRRVNDQDSLNVGRDGRTMGRDDEDGPLWSLTLRSRVRGNPLAELGRLRTAWEGPRKRVGATSVLRYCTDGRIRRVYGRPRGFAPATNPTERAVGFAEVDVTFQLTDPAHYEDGLNSQPYSGVGQTTGGLVAPLRAPLSTRRVSGSSARFITVGGDAPAPLAVRFDGPSITPRLWTADGRIDLRLTGSLAYDQSVTVDARQMTVLRNDGASVPGMLSPRTRMADLVLPPGRHEVFFSGAAEASVTVAWRNAWRSF